MIRNQPQRTRPSVGRRAPGAAVLIVLMGCMGLAFGGCTLERVDGNGGSAASEPDFATQVESLLNVQAAAWNGGDLEGFMSGYSPSPTTTYFGSGGLIEGYDAIRERYAPDFEAGATRDSLRFEALQAREVETRVGVATARYVLERDGTVTSTGPFTLVLLNVEGVWMIVHDQSAEDAGS